MHCSWNHSALLEFDFDPLNAGAKNAGPAAVRDALAPSGTATQMHSIRMGLTASTPEARGLKSPHHRSSHEKVESVKQQNKWRHQYFKRCRFGGTSLDTGLSLALYLTHSGRMGWMNSV